MRIPHRKLTRVTRKSVEYPTTIVEVHDDFCSTCKVKDVPLIQQDFYWKKKTGIIRYRKQCRACNTARAARYRRTQWGRIVIGLHNREMASRHPEKLKARQAVSRALRRGELAKLPCRCGSEKAEAHHSDYSKPLEVKWLCRQCHADEHRRLTRLVA